MKGHPSIDPLLFYSLIEASIEHYYVYFLKESFRRPR